MGKTFKLIGFIAVVAVIGLSFVACGPDEDERIVTVENQISIKVNVTVAGWELYPEGGAASFELPGWSGQLAAEYPKRQISKIGSDIRKKDIRWASSTPNMDGVMYEAYLIGTSKIEIRRIPDPD
jgi:hypothetical protein